MNAENLMLDDWVRIRRVDVPDSTFYTTKALSLQKNGFLEYEPIPLSEEMLCANAMDNEDYTWWYDITTERYMFKIYGYIRAFEGTLSYVHELQQVLRLCGLNELANNFIV